ncbi:MAG: glucokinase, partial [Burkholderiales bacterium]|nr:glucokinase [Burkholderiales bacterium]
MNNSYPRLIADIGGTNARFSIETAQFTYEYTLVLACKDYADLSDAIANYLNTVGFSGVIKNAAIALPAPEVQDMYYMANSPWQAFSANQARINSGFDNLLFLNDFHDLALAVPFIDKKNLIKVGGLSEPDETKPIAIIGPGTGLGIASLIKSPNGDYITVPSEGSRSSFSPVNEEEIDIWKFVHRRFSHVSFERLVSGSGLQLIYEALHNINRKSIEQIPAPAKIVENGINSQDWICKQTVDIFCRLFGTVVSNFAVSINAFGGIYIGGGIIPKMLDYFVKSEFRSRFEDKGRYRPYLVNLPIY